MNPYKHIIIAFVILCLSVILTGCGAQKKMASTSVEEPVEQTPAWHTCLMQGARASLTLNDSQYSANITMQTVRDSMIVISVMPLFGIEALRLEATPLEIIGIDKLHGQYVETTFAELNRKLTPSLNWDVLQQLCSGELPTGSDRARLLYTFGDDVIELTVTYPVRQLDVPVRVTNQRTDRYTKIDISKWL